MFKWNCPTAEEKNALLVPHCLTESNAPSVFSNALQQKTSATQWDWFSRSTPWHGSQPMVLHLFWIWFWQISLKISAVLPLLQSVLLITCLSKWTSLWLLSENHLSVVESGVSLKPTGRVSKQPSNFETGLPSWLSPTSTRPGNSFKETCCLSVSVCLSLSVSVCLCLSLSLSILTQV